MRTNEEMKAMLEKGINPFTGRPYGKPGNHVRDRIASMRTDAANLFEPPKGLALYMATVIESPACWPRVLNGTMTHERFAERHLRMTTALLRGIDEA